ncbi:MAG: hypothetical protein VB108_02220 [Anaerolineaceae bacterium]|nr:hypothetical protein [Anaerolineaceae bacterium]
MNKKILAVFCVLLAVTMACNLPTVAGLLGTSPTATPTPEMGLVRLQGAGMSIMLSNTYIGADITQDLPGIVQAIKSFFGEDSEIYTKLAEGIEDNIAWWGYDSATPEPTKLLAFKNGQFSFMPLTMLNLAIQTIIQKQDSGIESRQIKMNGREMIRLNYSKDNNAWVAYLFKEEGLLWGFLWMTSPATMQISQNMYDTYMGTVIIDPVSQGK